MMKCKGKIARRSRIGVLQQSLKGARVRRAWKISPVTRIKESKKVYRRSREKNKIKESLKDAL